MCELRPGEGRYPYEQAEPRRRIGRGVRRFLCSLRAALSDLRAAWRDPAIPAATPALRDYPIRRP